MEALDAAAVEAALSLCEEAVSEGHTLPGPWETQELKAADPTPTVQDSNPTQEPQDVTTVSAPTPASTETHTQPEAKREEQQKGNCEGPEVTGSDVTSSVTSDDGATGSEVTEEAATGKEVTVATVKSEVEEWSQPEPNPPCLGGFCTNTICAIYLGSKYAHLKTPAYITQVHTTVSGSVKPDSRGSIFALCA